jgi:hypothetical protein
MNRGTARQMNSNKELIFENLEIYRDGICDDCLSDVTGVRPRQQVNSICRSLVHSKKLIRKKAECQVCRRVKLINIDILGVQKSQFSNSAVQITESRLAYRVQPDKELGVEAKIRLLDEREISSGEIMDSCRREMVRIFNCLDRTSSRQGPQSFSERLSRLTNENSIPKDIFVLMRMLNTFRNLVVYEDLEPNDSILGLIRETWDILKEWWKKVKQHL